MAWLFVVSVFWRILKVSDTIYVVFNIFYALLNIVHTHRLKTNLLLNMHCISIYTSTETKYTHPDTGLTRNTAMNIYNSTVDVFKIVHNNSALFCS